MAPNSDGPGRSPQRENRTRSNQTPENLRSAQRWNDVPRGTMEQVRHPAQLGVNRVKSHFIIENSKIISTVYPGINRVIPRGFLEISMQRWYIVYCITYVMRPPHVIALTHRGLTTTAKGPLRLVFWAASSALCARPIYPRPRLTRS